MSPCLAVWVRGEFVVPLVSLPTCGDNPIIGFRALVSGSEVAVSPCVPITPTPPAYITVVFNIVSDCEVRCVLILLDVLSTVGADPAPSISSRPER